MAEESKVPHWDATKFRLGVMVAVNHSKDPSVVEINPATMRDLGFEFGYVVVKGKMRLRQFATAMENPDVPEHVVACGDVIRRNLRVTEGDIVTVKKCEPKKLKEVELFPIEESVANAAPGSLPTFLEAFFKGPPIPRPLGAGNLISVPGSGGTPFWFKVGKVRPESGSDKFGFVETKQETDPETGQVLVPRTSLLLGEAIKQKVGEKFITQMGYGDIGGLKPQLRTIRENVELPLKFPKLFTAIGVKPPKGVLMHGPPGCGKTLIARAIANELGCHFVKIDGPEIISGVMGEAEQKLDTMWKTASENAPAIIVIDEIDAIAPNRDKVAPSDQGSRAIVAKLLTLMDGIGSAEHVMVIACTNRPETLDPALRRSGRFDTDVAIPVPNEKGRREILDIFINRRGMKVKRFDAEKKESENRDWVDLDVLARETRGYVGADLNAMVKAAARHYLERASPMLVDFEESDVTAEFMEAMEVTMEDFRKAMGELQPSCLKDVTIEMPTVSFNDIGGLEDVKEQMKQMIEYPVKYRKMFRDLNLSAPRGALLYGPPGCGKTLMAKAIANECGANFIGIQASQLKSKWIGSSEEAVRGYFDRARQSAPCVLFFDEFDAMASRRTGSGGPNDRIVNQLLCEMDGLNTKKAVFVIGATNYIGKLDSAILRTGRLDSVIYLGMPDEAAIMDILRKSLKKSQLQNVALDVLAHDLANRPKYKRFSGADVAGLCQRAVDFTIQAQIAAEDRGEVAENVITAETLERAYNATFPSNNEAKQLEYEQWHENYLAEQNRMRSASGVGAGLQDFHIPEGDERLSQPPSFGLAHTEAIEQAQRSSSNQRPPTTGGAGAGVGAGAGAGTGAPAGGPMMA